MRILVTGANGFVGRPLVEHLKSSHQVVALSGPRSGPPTPIAGAEIGVLDLEHPEGAELLLENVDAVIHLAAYVHVRRGSQGDDVARFRALNVEGSVRLAQAAAKAGVRRFIFLSSAGVHGEDTGDVRVTEDSPIAPPNNYCLSKAEAEAALLEVARQTGLEVVSVRAPIIVGPEPMGNLRQMLRLVDMGLPLPFGSINNLKTYISLGNLIAFMELCLTHPGSTNESFLIADEPALSTRSLAERIAAHMGRRVFLAPVPVVLMKAAGKLLGISASLQGLWCTSRFSTDKAERLLGWRSVVTLDDALAEMTTDYVARKA